MKNEDVSKVLNDVQDMKGRQDEMTMKLDQIKRFETFQFITACWGDNPWGGGDSHISAKKACAAG